MRYLCLFFSILVLPLVVQANLEIEAFDLFLGDSYGEFKDNIVVCLSDGSKWKCHPEDTERLVEWKIGESVSIAPRTSFYWFKREHKFRLSNLNTGESVKAMLVDAGEKTLTVISVFNNSHIEYRFTSSPIWDHKGNISFYYHNEPYVVSVMYVNLSDGSEWKIHNHLDKFRPGVKVYISSHKTEESSKLFLIIGNEREAVYLYK